MASTISISLPESLKEFVEHQASKRGYKSVTKYLQAVIRELKEQDAAKRLDAEIRKGLRSPSIRMNDRRWRAMEERIRNR